MERVTVEPMTKATVIISDSTDDTDLSAAEHDPLVEIINKTRLSIQNQVYNYLVSLYNEKLAEITRCAKSQVYFDKKKRRLDEIFASKKERIERVFGEFQVVSPLVVIYGSPMYSNYAICTYGKSDWYKNAFWIHENSIKEIMQSIPQGLPVQQDVIKYFDMLKNIKKLANMSDKKDSV